MAGREGELIVCQSNDEWNQLLQWGKDSNKLVVAYFGANWCGPCRMVDPYVEALATEKSNVLFLKVDIDKLRAVETKYRIRTIPQFILFKGGNEVQRVEGVPSVGTPDSQVRAAIVKNE